MSDPTWVENLVSVLALLVALELRALLARRYPSTDRRNGHGLNGD